ncbi:hypothetical protein GCM10010218_49830 [Streptomyces mashuensis]|uniref:FtsX-like permease family protein n=1 Tax=Streptomyces mashuensis TaxID=33904 RepID=A0A919B821_9ACTN|nr:hypothetical protein [Streptomyces mashuensis]GHF62396.1 hypothetical protein GCM10010218_49830 [Streptomyces mashuensis]
MIASRSLLWHMLRTGRAASRHGEGGRGRFLALLTATAVMVVAGASLVMAMATFDGREARGEARNPVMAAKGEQPKVLWSRYWENYQGRQFSVVVVEPLTDDAPLPPGLHRWPGPGESALSPALADGPRSEDFRHRYGKMAERIGDAGLATPGERLAYTRPSKTMLDSSYLDGIVGFGSPGPTFGDLRLIEPEQQQQLLMLLAALVLLPTAALAVAAARMGAQGQDHRTALLRALGADRAALAWMNIGAAGVPVVLGAAVGLVAVVPFLVWNVRLPWIDFTLAATDLRQAAGALAVAPIAALVVMLALVVLIHPRQELGSTRVRAGIGGRVRRLALSACPVFAILALVMGSLGGSGSAFGYLVAVIGVWATVPSVIGWGVSRLAPRMATSARKRGNTAGLIASRTLAAHPGVIVRLVAALVIAIGIIGQTQLISSLLSTRGGNPAVLRSGKTQSMALVQAADRARPSQQFRAALPEGARMVALGHSGQELNGGDGPRIIQAPCADLRALSLPCPRAGEQTAVPFGDLDRRLKTATYTYFGNTAATVRVGEPTKLDREDAWYVVFTPSDQPLDIPAVKTAARQALSTDANIKPMLEGSESFTLAYQSRWLPFLGAAGTIVLALAMVFAAFSEYLRFARSLAPLAALTGNSGMFRATAAWALGAPVAVAGALGLAVYAVLGQAVTGGPYGASLSGELCLVLLLIAAAAAAAITWLAGREAERSSHRWKPRAD